MTISFDGRVAIVTGAGGGLGRSHALGLAARGAKVVVNDLGGAKDGTGASSDAAESVVAEIEAAGGEAIANGASVTDLDQVEDMVASTIDRWGQVDILVNNAGILRDKSFTKMTMEDFRLVLDVHLMGSVYCTKAVWDHMREQEYGRIVMTTSASGMYGNFGQSNYGTAKMGLVGLMNTLVIEGMKYGVRVNTLAPSAATRMTEEMVTGDVADLMTPESVTAGLLMLCGEEAPNRQILCCTAGGFAATHIYESEGIYLKPDQQTPEEVLAQIDEINNPDGEKEMRGASDQIMKFLNKAAKAMNVEL